MALIPTDGRDTMAVLRESRTLDRFLDDIWDMRDAEHGCRIHAPAARGWPFIRAEHQDPETGNVQAIGKRSKR